MNNMKTCPCCDTVMLLSYNTCPSCGHCLAPEDHIEDFPERQPTKQEAPKPSQKEEHAEPHAKPEEPHWYWHSCSCEPKDIAMREFNGLYKQAVFTVGVILTVGLVGVVAHIMQYPASFAIIVAALSYWFGSFCHRLATA